MRQQSKRLNICSFSISWNRRVRINFFVLVTLEQCSQNTNLVQGAVVVSALKPTPDGSECSAYGADAEGVDLASWGEGVDGEAGWGTVASCCHPWEGVAVRPRMAPLGRAAWHQSGVLQGCKVQGDMVLQENKQQSGERQSLFWLNDFGAGFFFNQYTLT